MKNNRKIILLSVIVLIVAVGSATALAVFSGQTPQTASDISPQEAEQPVQTQAETAAPVIRTLQDGEDAEAAPAGTPATEVPQTRVAAAADGTQTQMTFVKQDPQLDGAMRYFYQDAKGDTYRFDGAGNLVGFEQKDFCFQPTIQSAPAGTQPISQETAVQIAEQHCAAQYGAVFSDYTLDSVHFKQDTGGYYIFFYAMCGPGDFVRCGECSVSVTFDGDVAWSVMSDAAEQDAFDLTVADNVNKAQIDAFVLQQVQQMYGDKLYDYKTEFYRLTRTDSGYAIEISICAQLVWSSGDTPVNDFCKSLYYEIA